MSTDNKRHMSEDKLDPERTISISVDGPDGGGCFLWAVYNRGHLVGSAERSEDGPADSLALAVSKALKFATSAVNDMESA